MCFSVATCCVASRFFDCAMALVMMLLKIHGDVSAEDMVNFLTVYIHGDDDDDNTGNSCNLAGGSVGLA